MAAGPTSDAVLVNIVLDGKLEQLLRDWRAAGVSYEDIARYINELVKEQADSVGAPTRYFKWSAVRRWCIEQFKIGI